MDKKFREDKGKVARGGANKRKFPSKAATYIHENSLDIGRVLDFGCGYGLDAASFGWECYDPYYHDIKLEGLFDTIICINVISAVSKHNETKILEEIKKLLKEDGKAYIAVPRTLTKEGKLSGYNRRPQRYIVLKNESIFKNEKFEIYLIKKND